MPLKKTSSQEDQMYVIKVIAQLSEQLALLQAEQTKALAQLDQESVNVAHLQIEIQAREDVAKMLQSQLDDPSSCIDQVITELRMKAKTTPTMLWADMDAPQKQAVDHKVWHETLQTLLKIVRTQQEQDDAAAENDSGAHLFASDYPEVSLVSVNIPGDSML